MHSTVQVRRADMALEVACKNIEYIPHPEFCATVCMARTALHGYNQSAPEPPLPNDLLENFVGRLEIAELYVEFNRRNSS